MKSVDSSQLEDEDGYITLTGQNKMELVKLFIEWLEAAGAEVAWVAHSGVAMNFHIGPDPRKEP